MGERAKTPVPYVVRKHADRAILLVSSRCHVYCRFCFRRTFPDGGHTDPEPAAMVTRMDKDVGRMIDLLEELNNDGKTLVLFTSDNGGNMYDGPDGTTPTNNYPLRAGKGINYEGGTRVPLIVKVPGLTKAGSKSKVVVSTVDRWRGDRNSRCNGSEILEQPGWSA